MIQYKKDNGIVGGQCVNETKLATNVSSLMVIDRHLRERLVIKFIVLSTFQCVRFSVIKNKYPSIHPCCV